MADPGTTYDIECISRDVRVLVLGCGDVGSAVAHALFLRGARVAMCDLPRPAHARRGMAYTDALFDGRCRLDGVTAIRVADLAGVRALWASREGIPVASLPEAELLAEPGFDVLVEATMRRWREVPDIRPMAALAIGLGPGYVPGANCHVAVETRWGEDMGALLRDAPAAVRAGGPRPLDGVGRERFVPAPCSGRWHTRARIGDPVAAGAAVGDIEGTTVRAPIAGVLRGVTRDDVDVRAGQRIVEVDPRATPQVFGLGERPLAIARGVVLALQSATEAG